MAEGCSVAYSIGKGGGESEKKAATQMTSQIAVKMQLVWQAASGRTTKHWV
jgi:hypothetical protein